MKNEESWLLNEKYNGVETPEYFADIKRLQAGEPLGYLIGHVPFLDTTIYLDSHPLIPRPETEYWVEKVIKEIRSAATASPRILDLCAGSGCIGVGVAKALPSAQVTFGEIEKTHLPTIATNLESNDIDCTRYQVFPSDLFKNLSGQFDYILSNPPYIDPVVDRAEASVKAHEPHVALYGGAHGMEIIGRIIEQAAQYLTPSGVLYIEHEPEQAAAIESLAAEHGYTATTHKDQYDVVRYSRLTLKTSENMAQ